MSSWGFLLSLVDFDRSVIADGHQLIVVKGVLERRDVDNAADIHFHDQIAITDVLIALDGGR